MFLVGLIYVLEVSNLLQGKMLLSIKSGDSGLMISLDAFVLCAKVGIKILI